MPFPWQWYELRNRLLNKTLIWRPLCSGLPWANTSQDIWILVTNLLPVNWRTTLNGSRMSRRKGTAQSRCFETAVIMLLIFSVSSRPPRWPRWPGAAAAWRRWRVRRTAPCPETSRPRCGSSWRTGWRSGTLSTARGSTTTPSQVRYRAGLLRLQIRIVAGKWTCWRTVWAYKRKAKLLSRKWNVVTPGRSAHRAGTCAINDCTCSLSTTLDIKMCRFGLWFIFSF